MHAPDHARDLQLMAGKDFDAWRGLFDDPLFADEFFGFHAQQAIDNAACLLRTCCSQTSLWQRTKIGNLVALGVGLRTAIQHGVSSRSHWHMAQTQAVRRAPSYAWLAAQGFCCGEAPRCKAQGSSAPIPSSTAPTR